MEQFNNLLSVKLNKCEKSERLNVSKNSDVTTNFKIGYKYDLI